MNKELFIVSDLAVGIAISIFAMSLVAFLVAYFTTEDDFLKPGETDDKN